MYACTIRGGNVISNNRTVKTGDLSQEDMDVILILTRDSYYVAHYDDDVDKVTRYQRVAFFDIEAIEFGPLEESSAFSQLSFRRSAGAAGAAAKNEHHLRVSYRMAGPPVVSFSGRIYTRNGIVRDSRTIRTKAKVRVFTARCRHLRQNWNLLLYLTAVGFEPFMSRSDVFGTSQ